MKVPEPRHLKSGTWFIQLRLGGKSVPVSAPSKKECIKAAELIKAQYRSGKYTVSDSSDNITLRAASNLYIDSRRNICSPSTIRDYESIVRNRFQDVMDEPIQNIKNWQAVCDQEKRTKSAKTVVNAYHFIVSVLKFNNVTPQRITLPQIIPNERPWLEPEQIELFIKAVHGKRCEIPALMALHSLRRSEIMAVTWGNIDLENGTITVKGAMVPNEKHRYVLKDTNKNVTSARTVPIMIPALKEALESVQDKTGRAVKSWPDTIWRQINKACERSGLPKVGIHGLRHSFASLAYHLGMPEKEVMEIGGWADPQTVNRIYTHLAKSDRAKAVNKMTEFYKNANKTLTSTQTH